MTKRKQVRHGYTSHAGGRVIDIISDHSEWTSWAINALNAAAEKERKEKQLPVNPRWFPYDHLQVGGSVNARRVRFQGSEESDAIFGNWGKEIIRHIQRDKDGRICVIAFVGYSVEFDPRHDWCGEGPFPCLMNEEWQLQIRGTP